MAFQHPSRSVVSSIGPSLRNALNLIYKTNNRIMDQSERSLAFAHAPRGCTYSTSLALAQGHRNAPSRYEPLKRRMD